jgi:type IVB pilus formation R64 PilN family outer membrane protein
MRVPVICPAPVDSRQIGLKRSAQRMSVLMTAVLLSACASKIDHDVQRQIDEGDAKSTLAQSQINAPQRKQAYVVDEVLPRFATRTVPLGPSAKLPQLGKVTLRYPGRQTLLTTADLISRAVDIPIVVTSDALLPPTDFEPGKGASPSAAAPRTDQKGSIAPLVGRNLPDQEFLTTYELNYSGDLAGLLDQITKRGRLGWRYEGGVITISRMVRRSFAIKTMPSTSEAKGSLTMTPGEGSSSSMSVTTQSQGNVFAQIKTTLDTMVSKSGNLQFDVSNGTVNVLDAVDNVAQIELYIDRVNNSLLRQVTMSVQVLQVDLNESNERGIDWSAVSRTLSEAGSNAIRLGIRGPELALPSVTNAGFSFSLIPNVAGASAASALVRALETFGRVSTSYATTVTTMNRQSVPLGVLNQLSYVKSVSPGTAGGLGTVATGPTLTAGQVSTGFTMTVTPVVLDSNRVILEALLSISKLRELKTFTSGSGVSQASVQTPDIDIFNTMQRASMMAGQTMVIAGYESEASAANGQDVVRDVLPGFRVAKRQRSSTVILITPRLDAM